MKANKKKESPDFLAAPSAKGMGIRRLNKKPMLIIGGLLGFVCVLIMITAYQRTLPASASSPTSSGEERAPVAAKPPVDIVQMDSSPRPVPAPVAASSTATSHDPLAGNPEDAARQQKVDQFFGGGAQRQSVQDTPDLAQKAHEEAWKQYYARQADADKKRFDDTREALRAATANKQVDALKDDTSTKAVADGGPAGGNSPTSRAELAQMLTAASGGGSGGAGGRPGAGMGTGMGMGGLGGEEGQADPNGQAAKNAFLKKSADQDDYLGNTREMPKSAFEVKAGTIIPGVMISGINSDLPGQILAQVGESVYDTATGEYLLIPQGSKLVGTYSSEVTLGQKRVLVAWKRIIFPDASSLNIEAMAGADQAGYAGFADKINNHYGRIFFSAGMLSIFASGVQLSQPQAAAGQNPDEPANRRPANRAATRRTRHGDGASGSEHPTDD